MTFTIEEEDDDDLDYSPTPIRDDEPSKPSLPLLKEAKPPETLVINAFPNDHHIPDTSCLLGDRVVGTLGFCGALALLSTTGCCCCSGCHRAEIIKTYNTYTLFGLCCPF